MAKNNELSQAELYRKERKERLAKESKKNAKRNAKIAKIKRIATKVVAVVVAAAIVLGAVVIIVNNTGSEFFKPAVAKAGKDSISTTEYMYYYRRAHMNMYSQGASFDQQYGSGMYKQYYGFDYTLSPDEQEYANTEDAETKYNTWDEYFTDNILKTLQGNIILANEAEKAGLKLDESEIKEVTDQIDEIKSSSESNGMTANAYLKQMFGNGVNVNNVKKWMLRDLLAAKYQETKTDELFDSYSADEITKEYNKNINDYAYTDIRLYSFDVETPELKDDATDEVKKAANDKAVKAAKKEANEFIKGIKSSKDFVAAAKALDAKDSENANATTEDTTLVEKFNYETVKTNFTEKNANWLFSNDRKAGDKTVFEYKQNDEISGYYAIYIVKPIYKDESLGADVKGFNFAYDSNADDDAKKAVKEKANAVADAWNKLSDKEKTEEKFENLVTELYPDDANVYTCSDYENYEKGDLDNAVSDFVLDASRKKNDVAVIETSSGCYVMLYLEKNTEANWMIHVREALSKTDYDKYYEALEKDNALNKDGVIMKWAVKSTKKKIIKDIKYYIYAMEKSSSASTVGQ